MVETQRLWDDAHEAERIAKSKDTLEIKIGVGRERLWHQDATYELQDAYAEKLEERRRKGARDYSGWDTVKHIQADAASDSDDDDDDPVAQHARSITPVRAHPVSSYNSIFRLAIYQDSPPPRDRTPSPDPPSPSPSVRSDTPGPQVRADLYRQVQIRWSRATREAHAAPVYLIPVPGTQEIPPDLENFEYCEQHYIR